MRNVFQLTFFLAVFLSKQVEELNGLTNVIHSNCYEMRPFIPLIANPSHPVGGYETLIKMYTNHKIVQVAHKCIHM